MTKRLVFAAILVCFTSSLGMTGCSKFMANLRRDLDDSEPYSEPTVGGIWTERNQLAEDRYSRVGHTERGPASAYTTPGGEEGSWVNDYQDEANDRDLRRGPASEGPSMADTPSYAPPVKRMYKNGVRATRADFVDEDTNEGSLWASDGQTNYYFTKNKVRGVGDILTIKVEDGLVQDTAFEVGRTLSPAEREHELNVVQERIRRQIASTKEAEKKDTPPEITTGKKDDAKQAAYAAPVDSEGKERKASWADVNLKEAVQFKAGDAIMAEIVERYPNGNYKIRGTKKVQYRDRSRYATLVGIAKGTDMAEDDTIQSGKLYEYRLEVAR